jgi:Antitoxin SocA-like, Panacea domain
MSQHAHRLTYQMELPGGKRRLREMILYISKHAAEMPRWGKTKLNRILWDADFSAFRDRQTPVTGRPYQRLKAGPAPTEMPTVLAEMREEGLIELEPTQVGHHKEIRIVAKTDANLHLFSKNDLEYVDRAIDRFWNLTATESSDESHGVAWKTRDDLDPLPYEAALLSDAVISGPSLVRIKRLAQEMGWKSH